MSSGNIHTPLSMSLSTLWWISVAVLLWTMLVLYPQQTWPGVPQASGQGGSWQTKSCSISLVLDILCQPMRGVHEEAAANHSPAIQACSRCCDFSTLYQSQRFSQYRVHIHHLYAALPNIWKLLVILYSILKWTFRIF